MKRALPMIFLALALPAAAETTAKVAPVVSLTWLGHATFELTSPGGTKILIDPFITANPKTPPELKKLADHKPDAILVSHSHWDHSADAQEIATASKAKVVSVFEWVNTLKLADDQKLGGNVGGTFVVGDVTIHLVPAVHSSEPSGRPVGFVLDFTNGQKIYFSGDTWIFGDMALIQEIYKPTVLLLQVGGGPYNEDPATAALAVKKYFKPSKIIPMHYDTWPPLADEAAVRAAFKGDSKLLVMKPGQTVQL
ncbi:MAG: metal-dependent hydrolase [Myxococcota bacterium]